MDSKDDFLEDLENLLPLIRDLTNSSTDATLLSQANAVLTSYADLIKEVADQWHALYSERLLSRSFGLGPVVITVKFTLDEPKPAEPTALEPDPDQRFRVDLDKWSVDPSTADGVSVNLPNILIDGYETDPPVITDIPDPDDPSIITNQKYSFFFRKTDGSGEYVLFDEAAGLPRRSIRFGELDALLVQNAWAGVSVTRNAELMEEVPEVDWQQKKTTEPFIYHTPLKVFVNPITPLIDNKQSIGFAELHGVTSRMPIHEQFNRLFRDLLSNIDSRGDTTTNPTLGEVTLKLTGFYSYKLAENDLRVNLPVLLVAPSSFRRPQNATQTTGDEVIAIQALCTSLKNWFNTEQPDERDGRFHFDITFYSDLADDDKPIFRLRKLFVPLNKLDRDPTTNALI